MAHDFEVRAEDQEFFAKYLDSFIPEKIFDAHTHLYRLSDFHGIVPELAAAGPAEVGWDTFVRHMDAIMPGRKYTGLCFGFPARGVDFTGANKWLCAEVSRDPGCRGEMLVSPDMDPDYIREQVRRRGFVGLKCYHLFAKRPDTFNAPVEEYLPEEHVRVADELGLSITLHMVRPRAIADPVNQESIARLARKYPNSRWILAHAARGFNPYHTVEGIGALEGLPNIWCDTSAVTEPGAYEAIVRTLGVSRLLYGADFPVTHLRGRCVAIGDSFLWLSEENTQFSVSYADMKPLMILLESLRALKQACWNLRLSDTDVERIFYGNAVEMFGIQ